MVVGLVDTGIDHTSCFFYDSEGISYRTAMSHRTLAYYYDYADGYDDVYTAHGTHVAGTLAGALNTETSSYTDTRYIYITVHTPEPELNGEVNGESRWVTTLTPA
jgi:subtilisin family serine protease